MESEWNCNQFRSRKCSESETSRHIIHSLIVLKFHAVTEARGNFRLLILIKVNDLSTMNVKTGSTLIFRSLRPCLSLRSSCRGHQQSASQAPKHPAKRAERTEFRPAATSKYDWIGPPDRLSNLRPIIYHIPEHETPQERKLRHLRQETEDWNHEFWANQNFTFSKEKEEYVRSQLSAKGLSERDDDGRKRTLSIEEMAVFYKHFLDKNIARHANYNREWYRRNFTITLLMARVALDNTWRTLTGQTRGTARGKGKTT
uniref:Cytochrome c oxidase assembly factor 8 n=2 Tax=Cyprinus carpio TaxID=7962 RepID=A0A8C1PBG5_CYPCA